ncbi:MAG: DUF488 family protein [Sulfobacillus sp.]
MIRRRRMANEGVKVRARVKVRVFSVGHSNISFAEFLDLLRLHAVDCLVDVRSYPGSRRFPHFSRSFLEKELPANGTKYVSKPSKRRSRDCLHLQ